MESGEWRDLYNILRVEFERALPKLPFTLVEANVHRDQTTAKGRRAFTLELYMYGTVGDLQKASVVKIHSRYTQFTTREQRTVQIDMNKSHVYGRPRFAILEMR